MDLLELVKRLLQKLLLGQLGFHSSVQSGSDFIELYVGVGAKRVKELYEKARKSAPSLYL